MSADYCTVKYALYNTEYLYEIPGKYQVLYCTVNGIREDKSIIINHDNVSSHVVVIELELRQI